MSVKFEVLESEVLRLPVSDRVRLLDRVVASLDADASRDAAWDALAAQRDAEIEAGGATETSVADVLARLDADLSGRAAVVSASRLPTVHGDLPRGG